jgi:hypothetical protein
VTSSLTSVSSSTINSLVTRYLTCPGPIMKKMTD